MGGIFSRPKAPDTSKQDAALAEQERRAQATERRQREEIDARNRARRRGRRGLSYSVEQETSTLGRNK